MDILTYFNQLLPVLEKDDSLYCISAWNDQVITLMSDPAKQQKDGRNGWREGGGEERKRKRQKGTEGGRGERTGWRDRQRMGLRGGWRRHRGSQGREEPRNGGLK